jgi:hypothetical protein
MRVLTAALVLFAVYFPVAIYAALSYRGAPEIDLRPLPVMNVSADGSCVSTLWVPKETATVAIYKDGVRMGYASKLYDDPGRLELATKGFTWKMVEFFDCKDGRPQAAFQAIGIVGSK